MTYDPPQPFHMVRADVLTTDDLVWCNVAPTPVDAPLFVGVRVFHVEIAPDSANVVIWTKSPTRRERIFVVARDLLVKRLVEQGV